MTRAYSEAAVEVLDILEHSDTEKVKLIPTKFINYLKENAAKDYKAELDYSKPINEMNIKVETKGILGTICRNWWWDDEKKKEYSRIVNERKTYIQKDYNTDIFKEIADKKEKTVNNTKKQNIETEKQITEYKKESIFSKILKFLGLGKLNKQTSK
ncbi:MAG: hypothetical protein IKG56_02450 [Clostridia bacterium]|nr:hypothetical protein [Clostridia bacterium]